MLAHLFLLAASAAVLTSAQSPSPLGPILGCTASSFATPSWFIQDLQYSSAAATSTIGNVSFHFLNRATNYTADMACQIGSSGWNACSIQGKPQSTEVVQTSIQVNGTSAQVLVNQTWTCNDRNPTAPLSFTAIGSNSITLSCTEKAGQGQVCSAVDSPLLVKGSLLSPVAITPVYAEGPTGHDAPGCTAAAQNPSWTLSTIYYANQTGDGVNSAASRSFSLLVTNPAIGYQASCMLGSFSDDLSSTPASTSLSCAGREFGSLGASRYRLVTDASFDPSTFRFTMNQTWYCDDTNPGRPLSITATGSEILPLNCTSVPTEGIPNGATTACAASADVTLKGKLLSEVPLPPYSIEDPVTTPDGCTLSSIFHPEWTFSAFQVDSKTSAAPENDSGSSSVSFEIILQTPKPGFEYPLSVSQDASADNNSWYPCVLGPGSDTDEPLWPHACSLQYSPAKKELTLKADWICNDLDPDHPILFSGITKTTINSPLTCDTIQGVSQCVTTDLSYSWSASISNVTWRPAPQQVVTSS